MEILRHPLYSILAVLLIGACCGAAAHVFARHGVAAARPGRRLAAAMLAGIGAAFIGFHAAMLSNMATGVILMPFAVSAVIGLLASFALRNAAR